MLRSIVGLAELFAVAWVVGVVLLTLWTLHRLLHPPRRTYASALAQGRPGEPDQLAPRHGTRRTFDSWTTAWRGLALPVWDFPGDAPEGPVFILTHGWGDSRIGALTRAAILLPIASRIIAWDMPGHGDAPENSACALGAHEHEALRTLIEQVASPIGGGGAPPVFLLGWSLGAGVSIAAMSGWNEPAAACVRGVIAEAPYRLPQTPARNMLRSFGLPHAVNLPVALALARWRIVAPPMWSVADGTFDRAALARGLACPLLVIHGEDDAIAPVQDGREIAAAAPRGEVLTLQGVGHYSIWTGECAGEVVGRVGAFVETQARA